MRRPCRWCSHDRAAHVTRKTPGWCNIRIGTGTCLCFQYEAAWPWRRLLAWMRRRPEPVTPDVLRPQPVPLPPSDRTVYDEHRTRLDLSRVRPYLEHPDRGEPR